MRKLKLMILAIFVFALNLIWEFSHYSLYIDLTGIPSTLHIMIASFADLFLVFFILSITSILRKGINWVENPNKLDYFMIIILGMLIAIAIEIYSVSNGRWDYTESMPVVLSIGISPLIQLFTTSILSLWLTNKIYSK